MARTELKITLDIPDHASAESLYMLVDVLEQIFTQLFQQYDDEITAEIIRRYHRDELQPPEIDIDDSDLPF